MGTPIIEESFRKLVTSCCVYLEQICVPERRGQAEDEVPFGVLGDGLHDGAVHDDEVLGGGVDGASVPVVARVEEQRRPLQAHPVPLPAPFPRQLHLLPLPQEPLLHAQEPNDTHGTLTLDGQKSRRPNNEQ